jgi:hypothetical protein
VLAEKIFDLKTQIVNKPILNSEEKELIDLLSCQESVNLDGPF